MRYCKKCIMPDSRPEIVFDEHGICDACNSSERKKLIDWDKREQEFLDILEKYRSKDGSKWDCIIPVSGGKDSCYQAFVMKNKYKMNPLCVNFVPCEMTDVGYKNLVFLRDLGFDLIQLGANREVYREMAKVGFHKLGDCCWPEHIGIFTTPVQVAVNYKIPLIIWGENSQFEYGGPAHAREAQVLDRRWLEEYQMLGYRLSDLEYDGFDLNTLKAWEYPADDLVREVGVTGLFLGYFTEWNGKRNMETMSSMGWHHNPDGPVEGSYLDYENLDCKWVGGLHDYLKYLKYGYGRATDNACIDIRFGRITREEGFELAKKWEGKVPTKFLPDFLRFINCSEDDFYATLDKFTNPKIFRRDTNGRFLRNSDGDLVKIEYEDR